MNAFYLFLWGMTFLAAIVFVALYFVKAGYGIFYTKKWGVSLPSRLGWVLMEAPIFLLMIVLWLLSDRELQPAALCLFLLFELHYFQRSFIFPLLLRTGSRMPLAIVLMAILFNLLNALMQGGWIFYYAPEEMYALQWFSTPWFWVGLVLFLIGMYINIDSDRRIRNLRVVGDKNHYLPHGGLFEYVTSANYFGELIQWCGFAVMSCSPAAVVFAWWTFANLVPRADAIYRNYQKEFPDTFTQKRLKRIIPFIY